MKMFGLKVKPKDIIHLDIDNRFKRIEFDDELVRQALKAWQPIKAEA